MKQSTNLELNEHFLGENECEELTHTPTTTGSKTSQKGVNSQVDYQNHNALGPQRSLLYRLKDSIEVKCKVPHSATNSQLKNLPENS